MTKIIVIELMGTLTALAVRGDPGPGEIRSSPAWAVLGFKSTFLFLSRSLLDLFFFGLSLSLLVLFLQTDRQLWTDSAGAHLHNLRHLRQRKSVAIKHSPPENAATWQPVSQRQMRTSSAQTAHGSASPGSACRATPVPTDKRHR